MILWPCFGADSPDGDEDAELSRMVLKATRAMCTITRELHDMPVVCMAANIIIKLSLHAGLAAGRIRLSCIGGGQGGGLQTFFAATGQRIDEATAMCTLAVRGQLVVTEDVFERLVKQDPTSVSMRPTAASRLHCALAHSLFSPPSFAPPTVM